MDSVNHPSHYNQKADELTQLVRGALLDGSDVDVVNMECFEAMVNMLPNVEQIRGYLRGNSFKYRWRYQGKAGVVDLRKAAWYEKKLLQLEEVIAGYLEGKAKGELKRAA